MSRAVVVDASVAVEYLLRTAVGEAVGAWLAEAHLVAPELLDVEVLAALRRIHFSGEIGEARAREALEDLQDWGVDRVPHTALVLEAWADRDNLSAYDAVYVALARLLGADLLTADGPLARAPLRGVVVHNIRG